METMRHASTHQKWRKPSPWATTSSMKDVITAATTRERTKIRPVLRQSQTPSLHQQDLACGYSKTYSAYTHAASRLIVESNVQPDATKCAAVSLCLKDRTSNHLGLWIRASSCHVWLLYSAPRTQISAFEASAHQLPRHKAWLRPTNATRECSWGVAAGKVTLNTVQVSLCSRLVNARQAENVTLSRTIRSAHP